MLAASVRSSENKVCEVMSGVHVHLLFETPEHWLLSPAAVPTDFKAHSFQGSPDWICLQTLALEALFLPCWGAQPHLLVPSQNCRKALLGPQGSRETFHPGEA